MHEASHEGKHNSSRSCSLSLCESATRFGQRLNQLLHSALHFIANLTECLLSCIRFAARNVHMELLATVPLLIIDDLGMRKLPSSAAEELLEIVMRRYERASTVVTSNRLCGAPHKRLEVSNVRARS